MVRKINRFLKNAVVVGGLVTAFQAAQTTKKETGGFAADKFVGNFKTQAAKNIRFVAGAAKPLAGKYFALFTGKSGKKSAVAKNETLRKVYETAKAVAPEAVEKVEEYVEDVQKNAPEYQAQTERPLTTLRSPPSSSWIWRTGKKKRKKSPRRPKRRPKSPRRPKRPTMRTQNPRPKRLTKRRSKQAYEKAGAVAPASD